MLGYACSLPASTGDRDERPHHDDRAAAGPAVRTLARAEPVVVAAAEPAGVARQMGPAADRAGGRRGRRGAHWYLTKDEASTDDAYTDGRAITVAPQVAGTVVALHVTDNQRVKAGDVLLEIDPRAYAAARDQAQGSLQVAEAQLANARINLEWAQAGYPAQLAAAQAALAAARAGRFKADADARRQRGLPKQATTQQEIDTATAALSTAEAQVDQAQAAVRQAELVPQYIGQAEAQVRQLEAQVALARAQLEQAALNLSWTRMTAPQDGWITKRNVEQGNYVQAGQSILSIVTPEIWITANFKESQLDRMRPGQKVDISDRCLSAPEADRPRRQHPARLRLALHRLPAGERHRQLREDRPARSGEDPDRQRPGPRLSRCRSASPPCPPSIYRLMRPPGKTTRLRPLDPHQGRALDPVSPARPAADRPYAPHQQPHSRFRGAACWLPHERPVGCDVAAEGISGWWPARRRWRRSWRFWTPRSSTSVCRTSPARCRPATTMRRGR